MLKSKLIPCALLAMSYSVFAQQIPSAGSQMQQIPPTSKPQKRVPRITLNPVDAASAAAAASDVKIVVKRLSVSEFNAYSEAELLTVTGFVAGSELSLADLRAMAAQIAGFYHRNGYFLAQAFLPV